MHIQNLQRLGITDVGLIPCSPGPPMKVSTPQQLSSAPGL